MIRSAHSLPDLVPPSAYETVRDLRRGEVRVVVGIRADAASAKRLADIGFVPGTRVEMVRRGSPCIVRVNGTGVGLGAAHQRSILLNREAISGIDTEPPAAGEPTASEGGAPREQRTGSHHG